ncbi:hypothetical protein BDN72DRAFT_859078 [Pluteus cervinus]|uniref:Uncharacterized protein n=1 Tax=Pluteus cervinus TaxID=181527 RepID=A0ACD3APN0_9AGAR|nr:hypothetical protein BDN72DRAFT_859078 [Pluteus cervinus]
MQAKFLSTIVLVAASLSVSAAPADTPKAEVYVCPEANWGGACQDFFLENGGCMSVEELLPGGIIGSIGPNAETVCFGHGEKACAGNTTWTWNFPGDADAGIASGTLWNGTLKSVDCFNKNT